MPARIIIIPGTVFNNLTIIKEVEKIKTGNEYRRAVQVRCNCGHVFIVRYNAIKVGNTTSCGCTRKYVTPENRDKHLKSVFEGMSIVRADSLPIGEGTAKVNLFCKLCNHTWEKDFNTLATKRVYCPCCEGTLRKLNNTDYREQVTNKLLNTNLTIHSALDSKLNLVDNVFLRCEINNCVFKRRVDVILGYDYGCPCQSVSGFKPNKAAVLYLLELKDENNILTAYKYGITNNFQQRLQQIKRKYPNTLDIFHIWEYELGLVASDHEKVIKASFIPVHDKYSMPDGYTETFGIEMLSTFLAIQQSQYEMEVYY